MFDSIFPGVVWIDTLHDLMKKFVSLTIVAMEVGKNNFSVIIAMVAWRNYSSETWVL